MRRSAERLEEDRMIEETARRFLRKTHDWSPTPRPLDRAAAADLGWFAMGLPEEMDGLGSDPHQMLTVVREAGRVLLPDPIGTDLLVAGRLLRATGQADLAVDLASGAAAFAFLPGPAVRERAGRFSGTTAIAPVTAQATHLIVATPGGSTLILPANAVRYHAVRLMDGRTGGYVTLEAIAPDACGGHAIADSELTVELENRARLALLAEALGAFEAGFALTLDYLRTRRQFGQTLASFQAVQHHMANAYCGLESFRSLILGAAVALDARAQVRAERIDAARLTLAHVVLKAVSDCIQVSGGIAMTEDYFLGHAYKRVQTIHGLLPAASQAVGALASALFNRTAPPASPARPRSLVLTSGADE